MAFGQVIVFVCLLGLTVARPSSEENARTTRTFGSFFGGGTSKQQQVDPSPAVTNTVYNPYERPLVYQVKYYDTPVQRDVGRNTIDKAGEVRQEIGPQRYYFYTTNGVVGEQVQQQQIRDPNVVQGQRYVYTNPVVGGGQPQTYIVGQVGNQQVLVPCPVDYVYQGQGVQPVVEKVAPVPIKPGVVQPVVTEVKGRDQSVQYGLPWFPQHAPRDVQPSRTPANSVAEVMYNPYGSGYYRSYGYGSYPSYVNPYVPSPYVGGVGYNYNYNYLPYGSDSQVVTVVPPNVTPQASASVPVGSANTNVNNPYVYVYRGGVGFQPVVYPYVVPVPGVVRPKDQGQGSASTRISVSSQGQPVQQQQQQQQVQQQKQQQAEAKKTTGTD